ncbi:Acetyltransferase (GNAT) family protein [compost metagenome]
MDIDNVPKSPFEGAISLKQATLGDAGIVFAWRNHPDIYRYFFNPTPVLWEEHVAWFTRALANPGCHFLIARDTNDHSLGVVRFEAQGDAGSAEVNIMVAPGFEGGGLGTRMLELGVDWVAERTPIRHVVAKVMEANLGSRKLFEKVGFTTTYRVMERTLDVTDVR